MLSLNSKITRELLSYFFLHEDTQLYSNEIAEKLNFDKRNLYKKLKELQKEGMFVVEKAGNVSYYRLNKKYPLYKEYKSIILKTFGIEEQLKNIFINNKKVYSAYIFGSYAKDKLSVSSDIDVLVIGDADTIELQSESFNLQKKIDREINLVNMTEKELNQRKKNKDAFVQKIFGSKKIKLK
jgi:predicted nucleotidyltransferase